MDSVTQLLLGAAVGESVGGRQFGRKAMAWGAFLGTLPDLDTFIHYANPVDSFTYHRSFSHAFLTFLVLTPLLVWLITRIHPSTQTLKARWTLLVLLCLITHALLDSLTIYGTQIFWPLTEYPVGIGSIFIIDPLYTIPLLVGILAVLIGRNSKSEAPRKMLNFGLALSSLYLVWSLLAQQWIGQRIETELARKDITADHLTITPAPFNTLLWRFIARVGNGYYDGYVSLLDRPGTLQPAFYPSLDQWIAPLSGIPSAQRLFWFTKGQFSITREGDELTIADLRMGADPDYVFTFKLARINGSDVEAIDPQRINNQTFDSEKLAWIFKRIGTPKLALPVGNFSTE